MPSHENTECALWQITSLKYTSSMCRTSVTSHPRAVINTPFSSLTWRNKHYGKNRSPIPALTASSASKHGDLLPLHIVPGRA